jgi:hypothetical protein
MVGKSKIKVETKSQNQDNSVIEEKLKTPTKVKKGIKIKKEKLIKN